MWEFLSDKFAAIKSYVNGEDLDDELDEIREPLQCLKKLQDVEEHALCQDTGTVTHLDENFGTIDNEHLFLASIVEENLKLRDPVEYSFHLSEEGVRNITRVKLAAPVEEENWWTDAVNDFNQIVEIEDRKGRFLILSNGVECCLDNITFEENFVPQIGDILRFDESKGRVVLGALQKNSSAGEVVKYDNGNGIIEADGIFIRFAEDVLLNGYEPMRGDKVRFTAIQTAETEGSNISLRAISVVFLKKEVTCEISPIQGRFIKNKWIQINGSCDFGEIFWGNISKLQLQVVNIGDSDVKLLRIEFNRPQTLIDFDVEFPAVVKPNGSLLINFTCSAKFVGLNNETANFVFDRCTIPRTFQMSVLAPEIEGRFTTSSAFQTREKQPLIEMDKNVQRTFGSKPSRKRFFRKALTYSVPNDIVDVFIGRNGEGNRSRKDEAAALLEICPILDPEVELKAENYREKFHTLLYLEEMAVKQALVRLSRRNVFFKRSGEYLVLEVANLAEQRPSLIVGDKIVVTMPWSSTDKMEHVGFIHAIGKDTISFSCHDSFHKTYNQVMCDVRFELGSSSFSQMHQAIEKSVLKLGKQILFPSTLTPNYPHIHLEEDKVKWFNPNLNEGQRFAVINALKAECRPLPHIIFGPPGTGKTVTVVEAVLQVLRMFGRARILVAAPSNSAADLLTARLVEGGKLNPNQLVRIIANSRLSDCVPEEIEKYCFKADDVRDTLGFHKITVGTCTSLSVLHDLSVKPDHFTHIFIDEAGYATEPQLLVTLTFLDPKSGVAVLAGDPEQLGPVVLSELANKSGLARSFLSRVTERFPYARDRVSFAKTQGFDPRLITRLTHNYRSVPEILNLPSRLFYQSELVATVTGKTGREAEIIKAFNDAKNIRSEPVSILFHGVRGNNLQDMDSPSWFNPQELHETIQYIRLLYSLKVDPSEIAVITPYRKQVQLVKNFLTEFEAEVPKVGSVEELQGQERQVVIMSCVRSRKTLADADQRYGLGFISHPKRVNVSLTRARSLLIVLGDPHLLAFDNIWYSVIKYCLERGAYVGCDLPKSLQ